MVTGYESESENHLLDPQSTEMIFKGTQTKPLNPDADQTFIFSIAEPLLSPRREQKHSAGLGLKTAVAPAI